MPMPSTMPATMVSTSASSSVSLERPMTNCVNTMPSPDSVTTAMTMPAQAQAVATASELRAPSTKASMKFSQLR